MGIPGRKPKPTNLKVLEGNPGKRPLPKNEPKPAPIAPKCPAWLDSIGKREWKRVAPVLFRLGLLTEVDGTALAGYCDAYSMWRRAREGLRDGLTFSTPNGYLLQKPEVSIANTAMKHVRAFCEQFGMTPSSRGRMSLPEEEDDDWDGLLD